MAQALVLGASGNFGAAMAMALAQDGWTVRRFARGSDMGAAAAGCDLIVNALNPPGYHDWARQIPAITAQVIAAARASGATVLIPGNVYVFGTAPAPWSEATPHVPCSRKGVIRAEMEAAYRGSGVPVIVLRGGDFMAADRPGTILNMVVLKGLARGKITAMGPGDVPHAWAWLPDMARAGVALANMRAQLPRFADVPFPGHRFSIADLATEIGRQTGTLPAVKPFPWWMMQLAGPFWELARELREMRYLYAHPHWLDGSLLANLVPEFTPTSFEQIVAAHLAR